MGCGWRGPGCVSLLLPVSQGPLMPLSVLLLQALYNWLSEGHTLADLEDAA